MTTHSSAIAHQDTPHETATTKITVSDATKRRAESVINDKTIDPQWRTIIRFALELNDPFVAELVSRAEAGENTVLEQFEMFMGTAQLLEAGLKQLLVRRPRYALHQMISLRYLRRQRPRCYPLFRQF